MKHKLLLLVVGLLVVTPFAAGLIVHAQEADESVVIEEELTTAEAEALDHIGYTPQAYNVDRRLSTGTVVQIDPEDSAKVIPATQDKLKSAFGVVISIDRLPLQISSVSDAEVFVATGGRHHAMVTNENGVIESGDFLAISSLSGTLMKSSVDQELVFAKALASFDGRNNTIGSTTLQDNEGRPLQQVGVGLIPIAIEIIGNPERESTEAKLPDQLRRIGLAIAEKEVSPLRIYISLAIITLSIIIALAVLYSGVRNAMIAIGRNPLSKKSIFKGLLQVILSAILVLIIGLFTVYLLLRL